MSDKIELRMGRKGPMQRISEPASCGPLAQAEDKFLTFSQLQLCLQGVNELLLR